MMGTLYFLVFQLLGILGIKIIFQKEKNGFCVLLGSVAGSFLLQWLPALFAFLFGFGTISHILALLTAIFLFLGTIFYKLCKRQPVLVKKENGRLSFFAFIKENPCIFLILAIYIYMVLVLWHHTLSLKDGAYVTGQSTYGDMNMHLGFITSIAKQGIFPPEYSILPGTKLAYPFLSDSISSSIYLLGAPLKWAYLLPMYTALLQVFSGMYLLTFYLLGEKKKSILSFFLFFLNGGFGVFYFVTKGFSDTNFTRIFTEFYQTPTNYVDENIQWHNVLVDMLIPQRATLFGWSLLFPLLYLLIRAWKEKKQSLFIFSGILAGGLPLIHTHSFLALGILCCGFLLLNLKEYTVKQEKTYSFTVRFMILSAILAFLWGMSLKMYSDTPFQSETIFAIGLILVFAFFAYFLYYFYKGINKKIWLTWGVFLAIVLLLAVPQLLGFTFQQATGEQFTRGNFDWANSGDNFLLFAIKNYGVMFFLVICVFLFGQKRQLRIMMPAAFLWLLAEFIVFQPNVYDNNKILLVAYLFFCIAVSDFIGEQFRVWCKKRWIFSVLVTGIVFLGTISALLTMGREAVSEYELYSKGYAEAAAFIDKNAGVSDTILTATNHNNAISSLTGRNIVCGSSSFLYYHGVNYTERETDVQNMYELPETREKLFKQYKIKYIVLGYNETTGYSIPDFDYLVQTYPIVFNEENVIILQVNES